MFFCYLFEEKYDKNNLNSLKSFAAGLRRDIDAIENTIDMSIEWFYRRN